MAITNKSTKNNSNLWLFGIGSIVIAAVLMTLFGAVVNVPAGSVGIMFDRMSGGVSMQTLGEGWHIAIPFMQTIYTMETRTQKVEYPASAASSDLQTVTTHVAVSYHVMPSEAPRVYKELGGDFADKIISPAIQEKLKASTARFKAEELIQERETVRMEVSDGLGALLKKYGLVLDEVSIVNFDFSPEFNQAIEQKVVALQNKITAENILAIKQVEAQQKMAEAGGIANSTLIQATADANAVKVKGEASAYSIEVQGNATATAFERQRNQVSQLLVDMKIADKWSGNMPSFIAGSGATPLMLFNSQMNGSG